MKLFFKRSWNNRKVEQVVFVFIFSLCIIICSVCPKALGAARDSQILSVNCPTATEQMPVGSEIDFNTACTITLSIDPADSPVQLQMRTTSDTTTKVSGNGANLSAIVPENRFFANGSFPITAWSTVTVESGITADTTLNLMYKTWEADVGDTSYTHNFALQLLDASGVPVTQGWYSGSTSINFTTTNITEISILTDPTLALTTSNQVFSQNIYYDSNAFTIRVKANNNWLLKTQMARNPKDDSTTEEINIDNIYFRCKTSSDYNCLSYNNTPFASTGTFYDVAQNNDANPTTGTSDNKSLDTIEVGVLYVLKTTTNVFSKSDYTSGTTFQLTAPR